MADAWTAFREYKATEIDTGKMPSADGFGTRAFLKAITWPHVRRRARHLREFEGGGDLPGSISSMPTAKLDGAHRYSLLSRGQLPPVNAFWSLTLYELPASLLLPMR